MIYSHAYKYLSIKQDEYSVNNSMLNPLTAGAAYIRVVIFY